MKKKLVTTVLSIATVAAFALTGCGNESSTADAGAANDTVAETETVEATVTSEASTAPGDAAGFTEYPIFEDEEVGFINLSAVYFQPVPMSNGNESIDGFDIHLEADISALENNLGFGVGDWVPYLTVDYKVTGSDGNVAAEGTFMEMSASDGPHYGANIALPDADTYSVSFTIHSPEENGYLLHTDAETGPGGSFDDYFKDGNLEYTFEGWDYTPQEW
ncbi:MAG: iron transporter [Lachnospiraceae bacterium]|nr:iron transporter [Lachnospiraceae bacterium]